MTVKKDKIFLAIDTATEHLGLALGGGVTDTISEVVWRDMSVRLHPLLAELMQRNSLEWSDIDGLVTNVGPGSFTSIRLGLAAAKGLALVHDLPVTGIDGFAALAAPLKGQQAAVWYTAIGGEVYHRLFGEQGLPLGEAVCAKPVDLLPNIPKGTLLVGNGVAAHAAMLAAERPDILTKTDVRYPDPQTFIELAQLTSAEAQPQYLRPLTYRTLAQQKAEAK